MAKDPDTFDPGAFEQELVSYLNSRFASDSDQRNLKQTLIDAKLFTLENLVKRIIKEVDAEKYQAVPESEKGAEALRQALVITSVIPDPTPDILPRMSMIMDILIRVFNETLMFLAKESPQERERNISIVKDGAEELSYGQNVKIPDVLFSGIPEKYRKNVVPEVVNDGPYYYCPQGSKFLDTLAAGLSAKNFIPEGTDLKETFKNKTVLRRPEWIHENEDSCFWLLHLIYGGEYYEKEEIVTRIHIIAGLLFSFPKQKKVGNNINRFIENIKNPVFVNKSPFVEISSIYNSALDSVHPSAEVRK